MRAYNNIEVFYMWKKMADRILPHENSTAIGAITQ